MAPAYVQEVGFLGFASGLTTQVISVTHAPSAGNRLILEERVNGTITLSSVSDTQGNTWNIDAQDTNGTAGRVAVASTPQDVGTLTTSDTISIVISSAGGGKVEVYEYSGLLGGTSGYLDGTPGTAGSGTAALSGSASMTTAATGSLLVTALGTGAAETTAPTIASPFNTRTASTSQLFSADTVGDANTYTASWSWTVSASWSIAVVGYLAATGAPASGPSFPTRRMPLGC